MTLLGNLKIGPKLMSILLTTGLLPLLVAGYLYGEWIEKSLTEQSFIKLTTVQNIRKGQIENYFVKTVNDIKVLAASDRIHSLLAQMASAEDVQEKAAHEKPELESTFSGRVVTALQEFIQLNGYQDLYIADGDHGHVLFSLGGYGESGSNLSYGSLKDSLLGKTWQEVISSKSTVVSDFEPYAPARNQHMAFISHPILNYSGDVIGVLSLRFGAELISAIVESTKGMGDTGESYLVGWLNGRDEFEFRSNMKTMGGGRYVVGHRLDKKLDYWMDAREKGSAGGHDVYLDSAGKEVLVAYDKLDIQGMDWFLISKIDKYEVTAPIRDIYTKLAFVVLSLTGVIGVVAWLMSRSFTQPIITGMKFADAVANGKFDEELNLARKDEIGDLARSLNAMSSNLREVDWLKSGKQQLDDTLRGEHDTDELARLCIGFMVKHLGAELGGLYLQREASLELRASYAFSDRKGNFNSFALGEGMIGQAALEGETLFFTNVQEDAPPFNYGAGEDIPGHYAAVPLSMEGNLIGVVLIGSVAPFTKLQKTFVRQNADNIAVLVNTARSRQRIADLLHQANQQKEELKATNSELEEQTTALRASEAELQAQQEELRVTNEELEEQAKALKESEAELQAQQEELRVTNEELQERTQALEEQKREIWSKNSSLEEAREAVERKMRELEVASKYKSEFLANMSHELRTPLNSILILSQLIAGNKEGNLTGKQVESAGAIHSSGAELLNLINEILDLSKVEAGKIDLVWEEVPFARIESDITSMFKDVAEEKGLDFAIHQAQDLPEGIYTDSQRLQQILRNLLTNAFKFTDQGKVTLEMERPTPEMVEGSSLTSSESVVFSVKDEGIGIPEKKQAAIFEAFQQADGSTSRKYGGTGLGLSISRELAKLLGGIITLDSVEGRGSTFTVILPEKSQPEIPKPVKGEVPALNKVSVEREEEHEEEATLLVPVLREHPDTMEGEVEDDRKEVTPDCKSLLIIEDDNQFSKVLRDFSREHGFKCIIAEDGEKGLHYADYYSPSAIILDIGLPGIDGWTVMERLKNNPKLRHIPVHFMSASDSSMDAMRMGAIGYVTKPVSMEKIEETLCKMEHLIAKPVSRLLLVEDDDVQRESIRELIGNSDVVTTAVATGNEAFEELQKEHYDCMILDLGLGDMSGFDLLEKIREDESLYHVPIIIYTGRELSQEEEQQLNTYAETIIIKGAKSPERLLDESALFLHRVEANLPEEKREMLKLVHDKEAVLNGRTILLVDDDMRNVFALSSVLEERNMEVVIARDGVECLEKLEKHSEIEGVLMDIMMPRMDGYDATREIRKNPKYRKLPIIALTAKAMKGDRAKCIEAGASDYLAKPVNPEKLLSMLRVWLY